MFNRSGIFKEAWRRYNGHFKARPWLTWTFNRPEFSWCLACAWQDAKLAAMSAKERREAAIQGQIEALKFKSGRTDIEPLRRTLEAELAALVS